MQSPCRKLFVNHTTFTALHVQIETPFSVYNCAGLTRTKAALDRVGLGKCGAQCKTEGRGLSKQWCYGVIVLSQPCYDLFDGYVLTK